MSDRAPSGGATRRIASGPLGGSAGPVGLSLAAAFAWAVYYPLVLSASPAAHASAILVYPSAIGGAAYVAWAFGRGIGRPLLRQALSSGAYLRVGLLVGMQVSALAATFLLGPVDASLLSLLGDVVATPIVAAVWFSERRAQVASPLFALGLALSVAGGSLAIAGGGRPEAIPRIGWIVVAALPATIALYFVLSARASTSTPPDSVAGFSFAVSAIGLLAVASFAPGGLAGVASIGPWPLFLLAVTGISCFFLGPSLYFRAIAISGLSLPPMLMTAIPVFTLLLSAVFLDVRLPWIALLGIPVAVAGGLVALRSERAASPPAPPARPT